MIKTAIQEQEIFLLQAHGGVGQDKATPPRQYAASDQPFNATTPAYRDSALPPKKPHGSQKRQLREVAGCVPQQTFDEIERMRLQWGKHGKKLSRSQEEHSVILTLLAGVVDNARTPDRRCRYTWRSEAPTSHCCCPRTTRLPSA